MKKRKPAPSSAPLPPPHVCNIPGCGLAGEYRAPLSPKRMDTFQWLCLEHVRIFNANWDYFSEMSQEEIEAFQRDALTGHRPTWKMGLNHITPEQLHHKLHVFLHGEDVPLPRPVEERRFTHKQRRALATLDMEPTDDTTLIKAQYKLLVKKYHPDVNLGDKKMEEKFKQVAQAYRYLIESFGAEESKKK
jgi:hypothetical protein